MQKEYAMRASAMEFRLRVAIMFGMILLGFWSPWIELWGIGQRIPLLEWLALALSRLGLLSFTQATPVVIVLATLIAALGAVLRVWGAAHLAPEVINNAVMKAGTMVASGPYRYMRNPLYLGSMCMITAIAFAMPVTGALLLLILAPVFFLRLILGEEAFLTARLGEPYQTYLRAVPRIVPLLRSNMPASERHPRWVHAVLSELNPIGIFLVTAILSWHYESSLMTTAIVASFGISLAVRGLMLRPVPTALAVLCLGLLIESLKMPWYRAAIISLGMWMVLRAFLTSPREVTE